VELDIEPTQWPAARVVDQIVGVCPLGYAPLDGELAATSDLVAELFEAVLGQCSEEHLGDALPASFRGRTRQTLSKVRNQAG
jgi:hypothetical protein